MSDNKWRTVGSLRKGKTGNLYLKVDGDIKTGEVVQLQDPRKKVAAAVEAGRMSAKQGEERLAKIPDYIRYDLVIPPAKA